MSTSWILEDFPHFFARFESHKNRRLEAFALPEKIDSLLRHSLDGGKLVRAQMLTWSCRNLGNDSAFMSEAVLDAALALELVHAYSLVHDDLPCMDNDDFRRSKPTIHRLVGDGCAVLIGDALLNLAFELLSSFGEDPRLSLSLVASLSVASGARGMVQGQWIDVASSVDSAEEMLRLHELKTGALFGAACEMGALIARHSFSVEASSPLSARSWGVGLGVLFQLVDDLHDDDLPYAMNKSQLAELFRQRSEALSLSGAELWGERESQRVIDLFLRREE